MDMSFSNQALGGAEFIVKKHKKLEKKGVPVHGGYRQRDLPPQTRRHGCRSTNSPEAGEVSGFVEMELIQNPYSCFRKRSVAVPAPAACLFGIAFEPQTASPH